jgi:hypothetical protein
MLFSLIVLISSAACSQSTVGTPGVSPTPSTCPLGGFAAPKLFYPSPGATTVPANLAEIIVNGIAQGTFALVAPNSSPLAIGPVENVPSPTPTTLESNGSPYYAIPVPTLSPGITYGVVFTATTHPCGPLQSSGPIGSFGT